jgi:replicative DNA helicase
MIGNPDKKILRWMLKGSPEFNLVSRTIDLTLLKEAMLPENKRYYNIITEFYSKYKKPPTFNILKNTAESNDDLIFIEYLEKIDCPEGEIGYFIDLVKARYNEYLIKRLVKDTEMSDFNDSAEDINLSFKKTLSKIDRLNRAAVFSEGLISQSVDERINNYQHKKENPNEIAGILSGYKEIDEYTYGLKNSEFMVIVGASSSGKSMLMLNIAINAWLGSNIPAMYNGKNIYDDGKNIVYVSLEMSKDQLEARVDANIAQIRHKALTRGHLSEYEMETWNNSLAFTKDYNKKFYILDMPRGSKTMDIEARLESISAEFDIDLLCVDYLGIMKPNNDYGQDWLDTGHVAADMHELCRKKALAVISAAQKKARDKKAKKDSNDIEDIGRSKLVGDNANIVLIIETRDEEHLREDMNVHIAKNRDGAKGLVCLQKEFEKSRINNYPQDWTKDSGDENAI